jgi:glycosyltransferase involved in cell wall biosynthesis
MTEASGRGATGRPLRILEIETFGHGGLMHYVHNLSCALADRGHRITLVTAAGYELQGQPRPSGVDVRPVIGRMSQRTREWLPRLGSRVVQKAEAVVDAGLVTRLVRRIAPDIVHLHSTNQIALAYLILLRALRVPVAVTAHVVTAHERTTLQDAVRRRIHQLSPLIIAHSEHDRRRLLDEISIEPTRVVVVPHGEYGFFARGVETLTREEARRSFGLKPEDETALFFGYIREYKGLDVLLDAWPAVAAARPAARLVVAGDPARLDPARRQELEAAATRVGAIHRFAYIPFSEVARYFAAADALVLPYRHVSQSGVLFLALAMGLPVVATRVGALAEVLRDGDSALLVEPGSAPALSAAVTRVLADRDLRARLADGGRRIAAECSWPSIAARTEAAFETLLRRQPGA